MWARSRPWAPGWGALRGASGLLGQGPGRGGEGAAPGGVGGRSARGEHEGRKEQRSRCTRTEWGADAQPLLSVMLLFYHKLPAFSRGGAGGTSTGAAAVKSAARAAIWKGSEQNPGTCVMQVPGFCSAFCLCGCECRKPQHELLDAFQPRLFHNTGECPHNSSTPLNTSQAIRKVCQHCHVLCGKTRNIDSMQ